MVASIVFFPLGIPIFVKDGKDTMLSLIFHALHIGVILWECTHLAFKEYEQMCKLSCYGLSTDAIADVLVKDPRTIATWQHGNGV
jgi:hypothetical protein